MNELKQRLAAWYSKRIVERWYTKWSNWAIGAALAIPDLLQLAIANIDFLSAFFPKMDNVTREQIRYGLIALAFVVRQFNQPSRGQQ